MDIIEKKMHIDTKFSAMDVAKTIYDYCLYNQITDLSNKKLNKLLYFSVGLISGETNNFIFDVNNEPFEAWPHGPVVRNIYHQFKIYQNTPIKWPSDIDVKPISNEYKKVLDKMLFSLVKYTANQLEGMSHANNSPWDETYSNTPGADIDNELIFNYFKGALY